MNPDNASLAISDDGLNALATLEGFRAEVYRDQAGYPTIGFGHKLKDGEQDQYADGISRDDALALLRSDVSIAENAVRQKVSVALAQEPFDALTIFVYNIGAGAFGTSSALADLNAGRLDLVAADMAKFNKVTIGGTLVVSKGLVYRRWREGWILQGVYDPEADGIAFEPTS